MATANEVTLEVDGREFPFPDFDTITFKEGKAIKNATGLRIGELADAFQSGDSDAILAVIIVAKLRADGVVDIEELQGKKISDLTIHNPEADTAEAEATGPLAVADEEAVAVQPPVPAA